MKLSQTFGAQSIRQGGPRTSDLAGDERAPRWDRQSNTSHLGQDNDCSVVTHTYPEIVNSSQLMNLSINQLTWQSASPSIRVASAYAPLWEPKPLQGLHTNARPSIGLLYAKFSHINSQIVKG